MEYSECTILRSIGLPKDRIHPVLIICGNIYRFKVFARYGKNYREFGEFSCYKAAEIEVDGEMILIACHGVSASSTAPMLRELMEMGVKVVIRSGSCGSYKPFISKTGDLCIIYASIRDDTSSFSEVDIRYPAVADYDVVDCLVSTSKKLGIETKLGLSYSSDLFYKRAWKTDHRDVFVNNCFVDFEENETSIIYVLSSLYGVKAGSVCTICSLPQYIISKSDKYSPRSSNFYHTNIYSNYNLYSEGSHKMVELALVTASQMNKKFSSILM